MTNIFVIGLLGLLICMSIGMFISASITFFMWVARLILKIENIWVRIIVVSMLLALCVLVVWLIIKAG